MSLSKACCRVDFVQGVLCVSEPTNGGQQCMCCSMSIGRAFGWHGGLWLARAIYPIVLIVASCFNKEPAELAVTLIMGPSHNLTRNISQHVSFHR